MHLHTLRVRYTARRLKAGLADRWLRWRWQVQREANLYRKLRRLFGHQYQRLSRQALP